MNPLPLLLATVTLAAGPQAADDLSAWKELDAIARAGDPPGWAADAAGSQPWLEEVFGVPVAGRRPGPRGEIVGYSTRLEPTREKSFGAARRSAVQGLKALLLWEAKDRKGLRRWGDFEALAAYAAELAARELDGLVAERFEQEVERPYGAVYRTALRVKAGDEAVDRLAEKLERAARDGQLERFARRRELFWGIAGALGMALVMFLVYSFLNAGTKGHFAWPLRLVCLSTLVALCLGLMYLKGWFP
ncbi:MAG: hypothetical protein HY721_11890 [Planctomycetes bacterium]|nr:hypothetical protein [Planctomycetota bacterium]